jgi:hypothetical protein
MDDETHCGHDTDSTLSLAFLFTFSDFWRRIFTCILISPGLGGPTRLFLLGPSPSLHTFSLLLVSVPTIRFDMFVDVAITTTPLFLS